MINTVPGLSKAKEQGMQLFKLTKVQQELYFIEIESSAQANPS